MYSDVSLEDVQDLNHKVNIYIHLRQIIVRLRNSCDARTWRRCWRVEERRIYIYFIMHTNMYILHTMYIYETGIRAMIPGCGCARQHSFFCVGRASVVVRCPSEASGLRRPSKHGQSRSRMSACLQFRVHRSYAILRAVCPSSQKCIVSDIFCVCKTHTHIATLWRWHENAADRGKWFDGFSAIGSRQLSYIAGTSFCWLVAKTRETWSEEIYNTKKRRFLLLLISIKRVKR